MSMAKLFFCSKCNFEIEVWDDGNPYIIYPLRKRNYFYHPDNVDDFIKQITGNNFSVELMNDLKNNFSGNAPNHICLDCGKVRKIDPDKDIMECKTCKSKNIIDTYNLKHKKCPFCNGIINEDNDYFVIS